MATKKTTKKTYVYALENQWEDRHGESGSSVHMYSTLEKANAAMTKDIKSYLTNDFDAVKADGTIDDTVIDEIDGNSVTEGDFPLKEVLKDAVHQGCLEINVDSSGTNASWSVTKELVK